MAIDSQLDAAVENKESVPVVATRVVRVVGKGGGFTFREDPSGNDLVKFDHEHNRYFLYVDSDKDTYHYAALIFSTLTGQASTYGKQVSYRTLVPVEVTKEPDGTFKLKELSTRGVIEQYVKENL